MSSAVQMQQRVISARDTPNPRFFGPKGNTL